jgi:hypothetical protein
MGKAYPNGDEGDKKQISNDEAGTNKKKPKAIIF